MKLTTNMNGIMRKPKVIVNKFKECKECGFKAGRRTGHLRKCPACGERYFTEVV